MVETAKSQPAAAAPSASDADLIAAARSGDAGAYGVLYERHAQAARRLARHIVTTSVDADDVVAETFTRVLYAIRNGNGPIEAFRPYLFTAVRRVAIDLVSGQRRQIPTDDTDMPDPGEPFDDPMVAGLERSLISRAFWSLPERWRAVLWHTEIEQTKPAEAAALLGLSPNGVSVLKRRAREGLRQAYLQLHLSDRTKAGCAPIAAKLGRYVRGGLSRRQAREIEDHLARCADCTAASADLASINDTLRGVLAPVVLGGAAAGYLASAGQAHTATAAAAARLHVGLHALRPATRRAAEAITHHPIASAAAVATAAAITVPSLYFPLHAHPKAAPTPGQTHFHGAHGGARYAQGVRPPVGAGPIPTLVASPVPTTTTTGGASPTPTRSPSRSGNPTPSGSPTSTPSPKPTPTVSATAKLSVSVQVAGLLNLGVTVLVTVDVSDPGSAATGPVTANITLPSGVSLLGLVGSSSWSCSATSGGQTCSHGPIDAGGTSSLSFDVLVANLTGCGNAIIATVVSGSLSATGASATKVQCL